MNFGIRYFENDEHISEVNYISLCTPFLFEKKFGTLPKHQQCVEQNNFKSQGDSLLPLCIGGKSHYFKLVICIYKMN